MPVRTFKVFRTQGLARTLRTVDSVVGLVVSSLRGGKTGCGSDDTARYVYEFV